MSEQDDAVRATDREQERERADQRPESDSSEESSAEQAAAEQSEQDDTEAEQSVDYWKAEADKWKRAARKAERKGGKAEQDRANAEVTELRETVANHESDAVEAAGNLAAERLHTKLARAGVSEQDAAALLEHIDPLRLLADGAPSGEAIESVASSLSRSLGRSGVDDDQGKRSETSAFSADDWIRRKARNK